MATWMSCHDAVQHYKGFLRWVKGEGIVDDDDDDEVEPKRKRWRVDDDMEEHVCGHKVAKVPGYGNVTVDALINEYLSVAQVHIIFQLPIEYGHFGVPLAYV